MCLSTWREGVVSGSGLVHGYIIYCYESKMIKHIESFGGMIFFLGSLFFL